MNIFKYLRALIFERRLKRAIKKADYFAKRSGYHFLVVFLKGRPVVLSKKSLKKHIKNGVFRTSIQNIENIALYKTYEPIIPESLKQ